MMRSTAVRRMAALLLWGAAAALAGLAHANPLLERWSGSNGGVPPFDKVQLGDFKPALEAAMDEGRRDIDAIVKQRAAPSFDNTIVAFERSGLTLNRVRSIYNVWSGGLSSPEFQALEREMAPRLAAYDDEVLQNAALFRRIDAVYRSPVLRRLGPEQRRLAWVLHNRFVRGGAQLDAAQKARTAQINQRLASLFTQFNQNLLADEERPGLVIDDAAGLAGLSPTQVSAAAADAERRGMKGRWVIANTRSAMVPFLITSTDRALREKGWRTWTHRGDFGDGHDNNAIAAEILALRAERSKLMGFASFAHWKLADTMAKDPQRALDLMQQVWTPALARLRNDIAQMQKLADAEDGGFKIQPWDFRYYAEKVRRANYDFDVDQVKPYLQLDKLREAMFWAAGEVHGLRFVRLQGVPVFHPDVTVYQVLSRDGKPAGLWYFDPFARAGKNSGAWMTGYRPQQRLDGVQTPLVSNNSNFIAGAPGEPVLISWGDAVVLFHEFGHALHGLDSSVTYATLASPRTLLDFVEFPSQLNEHWLATPQVLARLVNAKGESLPQALVDKIERAKNFNSAFDGVEYLASALVDMKLHLASPAPADMAAFEAQTRSVLGMPDEVVMRHRIPQFAHVFGGGAYAAGYYAYLWAQVLEYDAFQAFVEAGDPYDKRLAKRLRETIFAVGNSVDPEQAFRNFRGRDPRPDALLRGLGFVAP